MPAPIFYGVNRLDTSTVSAAATSTGFPLSRLNDRFVGPIWNGTGPVVWDQGGSPQAFDAVLGAAGHNLAGATLTVQTDDNVGFASPTTLGSLVAASSSAFRIPCSGSVERYSRLSVSGGPGSIQLAELFAAVAAPAPAAPLYATSPNQIGNAIGQESETGVWMVYIRGNPLWKASWRIPGFTRTVRDNFFSFFQAIAGGRPFFVLDDEGVLRFARMQNPDTAFSGLIPLQYQADFDLIEVGV